MFSLLLWVTIITVTLLVWLTIIKLLIFYKDDHYWICDSSYQIISCTRLFQLTIPDIWQHIKWPMKSKTVSGAGKTSLVVGASTGWLDSGTTNVWNKWWRHSADIRSIKQEHLTVNELG